LIELKIFLKEELFSIDRILSYLAQLIIAENWMKLNHEQGMSVVENIMKEQ